MKTIQYIILLSLLLTLSCSSEPTKPYVPNKQVPVALPKASQAKPARPLPRLEYTIVEDESLLNIKRSVIVRLKERVSKETLTRLANEIKNSSPQKYERTFILHYLPEMTIGDAAWATTHFNPTLQVNILGLTKDAAKTLTETSPKSPDVIGNWLQQGIVAKRVTIYKKKNKYILKETYSDGSSGEEEIKRKKTKKGIKFTEKEKNDFGEFYLLDTEGNLQIHDKDGLIDTMIAIK